MCEITASYGSAGRSANLAHWLLLINQLLYATEGRGVREQRGKKERSASLSEGGASRKVAWDEKKNKSVCVALMLLTAGWRRSFQF